MIGRKPFNIKQWLAGLTIAASAAFALTASVSNGANDHKAGGKPLFTGSAVPLPVRAILQRACQDCHSQNTTWPWYAHIPLISGAIRSDVENGRAFMDFSKWNDYTEPERRTFMVAIDSSVRNHLMPPPKYIWMHREARVSSDEQQLIRAWLLSSRRRFSDTAGPRTSMQVLRISSMR